MKTVYWAKRDTSVYDVKDVNVYLKMSTVCLMSTYVSCQPISHVYLCLMSTHVSCLPIPHVNLRVLSTYVLVSRLPVPHVILCLTSTCASCHSCLPTSHVYLSQPMSHVYLPLMSHVYPCLPISLHLGIHAWFICMHAMQIDVSTDAYYTGIHDLHVSCRCILHRYTCMLCRYMCHVLLICTCK